ncbi:hypothetical protein BgiMline_002578 [Biomphalaria glabrata]|uniref:Neugrin-like isoform X1 n=2 Tax=Biomphalaria glabrata TaxID=6526 RepID=A0A9U8E8D8_BIOGL|nr:neugrin-like isoform X1 [Biomphalaria glabrata]KAI8755092.1 neugrin-like [Biomphalaria glabrata]
MLNINSFLIRSTQTQSSKLLTKVTFEIVERLNVSNSKVSSSTSCRSDSLVSATIKPLRVKSLSKKHENTRINKSSSFPNNNNRSQKRIFGNPAKASREIDEDEMDYLEQQAHSISKYNSKLNFRLAEENFKRESIKKLYYARAKTIERKFFKKPDPPNLLTWSAKEQIRFLHEQYPEEWTVEKLADSFPVDKACIKKVLTSRLRLHREEDIAQHDLEVQKNWTDLKVAIESGQQDNDIYSNLKNINNETLISNASGISYCPLPPIKKKQLKIGPFSSIVKDCLEKKDSTSKDAMSLQDKLTRLSNVLADVSKVYNKSLETKLDSNQSKDVHNETQTFDYKRFSKYKQNSETDSLGNQPFTIREDEGNPSAPKNNILKLSNKKAKYLVSGNSVYDKNGEFLYKKP